MHQRLQHSDMRRAELDLQLMSDYAFDDAAQLQC
jgi:hypothetical protein